MEARDITTSAIVGAYCGTCRFKADDGGSRRGAWVVCVSGSGGSGLARHTLAVNRFLISVHIQRHHGNHREYDVQRWNGHGCGEEVRVLRRISVEWRKMPRRACMVTYRRGCCSIRRQALQVVWESVHDEYDVVCARRHGRHEREEGMRRCVSAAGEAVATRRFAYSLVGAYIFFLLR